jgi:hypothetical protein
MQRELLIPRPDWPQKMEEVGFSFSFGRPRGLNLGHALS